METRQFQVSLEAQQRQREEQERSEARHREEAHRHQQREQEEADRYREEEHRQRRREEEEERRYHRHRTDWCGPDECFTRDGAHCFENHKWSHCTHMILTCAKSMITGCKYTAPPSQMLLTATPSHILRAEDS